MLPGGSLLFLMITKISQVIDFDTCAANVGPFACGKCAAQIDESTALANTFRATILKQDEWQDELLCAACYRELYMLDLVGGITPNIFDTSL